jgi:4-hydroxy-tetrahydrodipicolinate synthase
MDQERIIGIKDSSGGMDYLHYAIRLARTHRPDWSVFVGPEAFLAESVLLGASGGVSGGANLFPELYVRLYRAAVTGDLPTVRRLHDLVLDIGEVLFGPPGTSNATDVVRSLSVGLSILQPKAGVSGTSNTAPFTKRDEDIRAGIRQLAAKITDSLSAG